MTSIAKPMNVGILGCGHISGAYLSNGKKFYDAQVVACSDIVEDAARAKAKEFNIQAMSVKEMLASKDIDIIVNLTVPAVHAEISTKILESGKHAYTEKPLGVSLKEGLALKKLAEDKGLRIATAPDTFLGGGIQTCRKLLDDGWVGKVLSGTLMVMGCGPERFYHPNPAFFFQAGGGPMMDLGIYYLTAAINLLGPVKSIMAVTGKGFETRVAGKQAIKPLEILPVHVPTHYAGVMEFACGAIVTMISSFDVWKTSHSPIELYGTEGSMKVPDPNTFGGPVWVQRECGDWVESPLSGIYCDNMRMLGVADLANAIATNRPCRCSVETGCHALEIMEAFELSSNEGRRIELTTTTQRSEPMPMNLIEGFVAER